MPHSSARSITTIALYTLQAENSSPSWRCFALRTFLCRPAVVLLTVLLCLVCISAAPQTDVPKPSPEVQALLDQGTAAEKGYRWEEALHLYEAALANARERQNRAGEGTALHDIGSVYLNTSRPQQALEYLQQALSIRKAIGDRGGEGGTLTNIGVAY